MEFKQLEAFVQVVNLGSFSKAAEKLHLTQPTISAHIGTLENELGCRLVVRTPKAATASETGAVLYEYALNIISLRDNAFAACQKCKQGLSGVVSISASSIPYQYILPGLMAAFRQQYPAIRFEVNNSDSAGVVKDILGGRAELGFAGTQNGSEKLLFQDFCEDELVVITPAKPPYLALENGAFPAQMLLEAPFIWREEGSGTRKETEASLKSYGIQPGALHVAACMDNPAAIKNAVRQGLGISVVSRLSAAEEERLGVIRVFPLGQKPAVRHLYIASHKNRTFSPAAARFMRFVLEQRPENPAGPFS